MRTPGAPALSSNSIISYSTVRCCSRFPVLPKGWPSGQGTNTARGGQSPAVISLTMLTDTVGSPSRSTAFWISPTERLQSPHAGASSATSAPASRSRRAAAGAVSSTSRSTSSASIWPMKLK